MVLSSPKARVSTATPGRRADRTAAPSAVSTAISSDRASLVLRGSRGELPASQHSPATHELGEATLTPGPVNDREWILPEPSSRERRSTAASEPQSRPQTAVPAEATAATTRLGAGDGFLDSHLGNGHLSPHAFPSPGAAPPTSTGDRTSPLQPSPVPVSHSIPPPASLSLPEMKRVRQLFELYDWVRRFRSAPAADVDDPAVKHKAKAGPIDFGVVDARARRRARDEDADEIVLWAPPISTGGNTHRRGEKRHGAHTTARGSGAVGRGGLVHSSVSAAAALTSPTASISLSAAQQDQVRHMLSRVAGTEGTRGTTGAGAHSAFDVLTEEEEPDRGRQRLIRAIKEREQAGLIATRRGSSKQAKPSSVASLSHQAGSEPLVKGNGGEEEEEEEVVRRDITLPPLAVHPQHRGIATTTNPESAGGLSTAVTATTTDGGRYVCSRRALWRGIFQLVDKNEEAIASKVTLQHPESATASQGMLGQPTEQTPAVQEADGAPGMIATTSRAQNRDDDSELSKKSPTPSTEPNVSSLSHPTRVALYAARQAACQRLIANELHAMRVWKSGQLQAQLEGKQSSGVATTRGAGATGASTSHVTTAPSLASETDAIVSALTDGRPSVKDALSPQDADSQIVVPSSSGVPFEYFAFFILRECHPFFFPAWDVAYGEGAAVAPRPPSHTAPTHVGLTPYPPAARGHPSTGVIQGAFGSRPSTRNGASGAPDDEEGAGRVMPSDTFAALFSPQRADRVRAARELFHIMDTNADGLVSWDDFTAYVLLKMQERSRDSEQQETRAMDKQGHGKGPHSGDTVAAITGGGGGGGADSLEYALRFTQNPVNRSPWQATFPLVHHLYHKQPIRHLLVCERTKKYVTAADDGLVKLWKGDPRLPDAEGKASLVHERNLLSTRSCITGLALSPPSLGDAEVVAVVAMDGTLTLIRTASGETVRSMVGVKATVQRPSAAALLHGAHGWKSPITPESTETRTQRVVSTAEAITAALADPLSSGQPHHTGGSPRRGHHPSHGPAPPSPSASSPSSSSSSAPVGSGTVVRMPFTIGAYRSDAIEIFFGKTNQYFHGLTVVPPPFEHLKRPVLTTSDLLLDFGVSAATNTDALTTDRTLPFGAIGKTAKEDAADDCGCWYATSVALAHIFASSAQSPLLAHARNNNASPHTLGEAANTFLSHDGRDDVTRVEVGDLTQVTSAYTKRDGTNASSNSAQAHPMQHQQQQPSPMNEGGAYAIMGYENGWVQFYELRKSWFCVNQLSATRVEPPAARAPALTLRLHTAAITRIVISEKSDLLLSASDDGTVCVRQLARVEVPLLRLGDGAVPSLSACLDVAHRYLESSPSLSSYQHAIQQQHLAAHVHGHTRRITCVAWHEATRTLVTGGRDYMLYYWSPRSQRPLQKLDLRALRSVHSSTALGHGSGAALAADGGDEEAKGGPAFGASGFPIDVSFMEPAGGHHVSAWYRTPEEAALAARAISAGKKDSTAMEQPAPSGGDTRLASVLRLLVLDSNRVLRILNAVTNQLLCVLVDDSPASLALGDMLAARFDSRESRLVLGGRCLRVWDMQGDKGDFPPSYTGHRKPVLFLQWSVALKAYVTADEDHVCVWELDFTTNRVAYEQQRWRRAARGLFEAKQKEKAQRAAIAKAIEAERARRMTHDDASTSDTDISEEWEGYTSDTSHAFSDRVSSPASSQDLRQPRNFTSLALHPPPLDFEDRYPTLDDKNPYNQSYLQSATRLVRSWRVTAGIRGVTMTTLPSVDTTTSPSSTSTGPSGGVATASTVGSVASRVSLVAESQSTVSANMEGLFVALLRDPAILQYNLFNGAPLRRFTFPEGSQELSSLCAALVPLPGATPTGDNTTASPPHGYLHAHPQPTLCAAYETSLTSGLAAIYPVKHDNDRDAGEAIATDATTTSRATAVSTSLVDRFALPPSDDDIIKSTLATARAARLGKALAEAGNDGRERAANTDSGAAGKAAPSTSAPLASSSSSALALQVHPHRNLVFGQTPIASAAFVPELGLVVVGGLGSLYFSPANDVTTRALVCLGLEEQAAIQQKQQSSGSNDAPNAARASVTAVVNRSSPRYRWVALCPGRLVVALPLSPAEETARMEATIQLLTPEQQREVAEERQQQQLGSLLGGGTAATAAVAGIVRASRAKSLEEGERLERDAASTTFFDSAQASSLGFLGHLCPVPRTPYLFSGSNVGTVQLWGLRTSCELARFSATLTADTITCMQLFTWDRAAADKARSEWLPATSTPGTTAPPRDGDTPRSEIHVTGSTGCYLAVGNQSGFVALFDMSAVGLHGPGLIEGREKGEARATTTPASAHGSALEQRMMLLDRWRAHRQDVRSVSFVRVETKLELPSDYARKDKGDSSLCSLSLPFRVAASSTHGESAAYDAPQTPPLLCKETDVLTLVTAGEDCYIYVWQWTNTRCGAVSTGSVLQCLGCFGDSGGARSSARGGARLSTDSTLTTAASREGGLGSSPMVDPPLFTLPSRALRTYEAARRMYVLRRLIVDHRLFLVSRKALAAASRTRQEAAKHQKRVLGGHITGTGGEGKASAAALAYEESQTDKRYRFMMQQQLETAIQIMEADARLCMESDPAWSQSLVGSMGVRSSDETSRLQKMRKLRKDKIRTLLSMVDKKVAEETAEKEMQQLGQKASGTPEKRPTAMPTSSLHDDPVALYHNVEGQPFSAIFAPPDALSAARHSTEASEARAGSLRSTQDATVHVTAPTPASFFDFGGLEGRHYWQLVCGFDPAETAVAAARQLSHTTAMLVPETTARRDGNVAAVKRDLPVMAPTSQEGGASCTRTDSSFGDGGLFSDVDLPGAPENTSPARTRAGLDQSMASDATTASGTTETTFPGSVSSMGYHAHLFQSTPVGYQAPWRLSPKGESSAAGKDDDVADGDAPETSPLYAELPPTDTSSAACAPYVLAFMRGTYADATVRDCVTRLIAELRPWIRKFRKVVQQYDKLLALERHRKQPSAHLFKPSEDNFFELSVGSDAETPRPAKECASSAAVSLADARRKRTTLTMVPASLREAGGQGRDRDKDKTENSGAPHEDGSLDESSHTDRSPPARRGRGSSATTVSEDLLETQGPSPVSLDRTKRSEVKKGPAAEESDVEHGVDRAPASSSTPSRPPALAPSTGDASQQHAADTRHESSDSALPGVGSTQNPLGIPPGAEEADTADVAEHTASGSSRASTPSLHAVTEDDEQESDHLARGSPFTPSVSFDPTTSFDAAPSRNRLRTITDTEADTPRLPTTGSGFAQGRVSFRVAYGGKSGTNAAPVVLRATPDLNLSVGTASARPASATHQSGHASVRPPGTPASISPPQGVLSSHSNTSFGSAPDGQQATLPLVQKPPEAPSSGSRPQSASRISAVVAAAKALQIIAAPFRQEVVAAANASANGAGPNSQKANARGATTASRNTVDSQRRTPSRLEDHEKGEEDSDRDDEDGELRPPPEHQIDDIVLDGEDAARVMQVAYIHRRRVEALGRLMEIQQDELRERILHEKNHGRGNRQLAVEAGMVGLADYHDFGATGTASVLFGREKALLQESEAAAELRRRRNIAGTSLVRELNRPSVAVKTGAENTSDADRSEHNGETGEEKEDVDWYTARERMKRARKKEDALWDPSRVMLTLMDWESPALGDPAKRYNQVLGEGDEDRRTVNEDPLFFVALCGELQGHKGPAASQLPEEGHRSFPSSALVAGEDPLAGERGVDDSRRVSPQPPLPDFLPVFLPPFLSTEHGAQPAKAPAPSETPLYGATAAFSATSAAQESPLPNDALQLAFRVLYGGQDEGSSDCHGNDGGTTNLENSTEASISAEANRKRAANITAIVAKEMEEMKERRRHLLLEQEAISTSATEDAGSKSSTSVKEGLSPRPPEASLGASGSSSLSPSPAASPNRRLFTQAGGRQAPGAEEEEGDAVAEGLSTWRGIQPLSSDRPRGEAVHAASARHVGPSLPAVRTQRLFERRKRHPPGAANTVPTPLENPLGAAAFGAASARTRSKSRY